MSIKATIIACVLAGIPALLSIGGLPFYILSVPSDRNTDKSRYNGYTLGFSALVFYPLLWFLSVLVLFLLNKFFVSNANKQFVNQVGVFFSAPSFSAS